MSLYNPPERHATDKAVLKLRDQRRRIARGQAEALQRIGDQNEAENLRREIKEMGEEPEA